MPKYKTRDGVVVETSKENADRAHLALGLTSVRSSPKKTADTKKSDDESPKKTAVADKSDGDK